MVLLNRVGNILGFSVSSERARWRPVGLMALAVPLAIWLASTSIGSPAENGIRAEEVVDDTAAASTSEDAAGETGKEGSWGEPVEGVQARLRTEWTTWKVGEPVALKVDVRNRGSRDLVAVTDVNYDAASSAAVRNRVLKVADGPAFRLDFDLEVDGQRFRQRRGWSGHLPFGPGDEYESVPVSLDRFWRAVGHSTADLHLEPGKHTIRAVFTGRPVESAQAPVLAVSNPVKIEIVPGRPETSGSNEARHYPAAAATALPQRPRAVLDAYLRWVAEREGDRDEGSKLRKMLCFVDKQDERWFVAFGSHNGEIYVNSEIFPTGKPVECKRASDDCWLVVLDGGVLLELWRSDGKWRVLCPTPGRLRRGVGKRTEATRPWHSGEVQKENKAELQRRRARYLAVLELSGRYRLKDLDRYFAGIPTTDPATLAGMSLDEFRKAVLLKLDAPFGLRYRVTAEAKSFGQREPVWVTFLIENVTDKPIKLKYRPSVRIMNMSGPMSGGVRVFPKGYNGDEQGTTVYPFKESEVNIPPGQTCTTRVDLRKYYVLPSARYRISARFYALSGGAEGFWQGSAVANMAWFESGMVTDPVQTKAPSAPPRAVAATPKAKSLGRAKLLKANSEDLRLQIWYYAGPGRRPDRTLELCAAKHREYSSSDTPPKLFISKAQIEAVVDHLAADGFLARAESVKERRVENPQGPRVTMQVMLPQTGVVLHEDLGWGPRAVDRLVGLRLVLYPPTAKLMDKILLTGLKPSPKVWRLWQKSALAPKSEPAAWGPATAGVQVRLRADKKIWKTGTSPSFKADVRNEGKRDISVLPGQHGFEVEVDGRWYFRSAPGYDVPIKKLRPGAHCLDVVISLGREWLDKAARRSTRAHGGWSLALPPGRHVVRVAPDLADIGVRAVSNPVEIEIAPGRPETSGSNETEDYPATAATALPEGPQAVLDAYFQCLEVFDGVKLRETLCFADRNDEERFANRSSGWQEICAYGADLFPKGKPVAQRKAIEGCWTLVLDTGSDGFETGSLLELWKVDGRWRVLCPAPERLHGARSKLTKAVALRSMDREEMKQVQEESEAQLERRRARYLAKLELSQQHRVDDRYRHYRGIPTTDPATLAGMSLDEFRKAVVLKLDAPSGLRYRVVPEAKSFGEREPVWVTFLIENVTDRPIKLKYRPLVELAKWSEAATTQEAFVFPNDNNARLGLSPFSDAAYPFEEREVSISPGQTYAAKFDLQKYYALPAARYTIFTQLYAQSRGTGGFWQGSAMADRVAFEIGAVSDPVKTEAQPADRPSLPPQPSAGRREGDDFDAATTARRFLAAAMAGDRKAIALYGEPKLWDATEPDTLKKLIGPTHSVDEALAMPRLLTQYVDESRALLITDEIADRGGKTGPLLISLHRVGSWRVLAVEFVPHDEVDKRITKFRNAYPHAIESVPGKHDETAAAKPARRPEKYTLEDKEFTRLYRKAFGELKAGNWTDASATIENLAEDAEAALETHPGRIISVLKLESYLRTLQGDRKGLESFLTEFEQKYADKSVSDRIRIVGCYERLYCYRLVENLPEAVRASKRYKELKQERAREEGSDLGSEFQLNVVEVKRIGDLYRLMGKTELACEQYKQALQYVRVHSKRLQPLTVSMRKAVSGPETPEVYERRILPDITRKCEAAPGSAVGVLRRKVAWKVEQGDCLLGPARHWGRPWMYQRALRHYREAMASLRASTELVERLPNSDKSQYVELLERLPDLVAECQDGAMPLRKAAPKDAPKDAEHAGRKGRALSKPVEYLAAKPARHPEKDLLEDQEFSRLYRKAFGELKAGNWTDASATIEDLAEDAEAALETHPGRIINVLMWGSRLRTFQDDREGLESFLTEFEQKYADKSVSDWIRRAACSERLLYYRWVEDLPEAVRASKRLRELKQELARKKGSDLGRQFQLNVMDVKEIGDLYRLMGKTDLACEQYKQALEYLRVHSNSLQSLTVSMRRATSSPLSPDVYEKRILPDIIRKCEAPPDSALGVLSRKVAWKVEQGDHLLRSARNYGPPWMYQRALRHYREAVASLRASTELVERLPSSDKSQYVELLERLPDLVAECQDGAMSLREAAPKDALKDAEHAGRKERVLSKPVE